MPELGEHLVVPELLPSPLQVLERAILVDDVGRKLEEDAAQLARRTQRLERFEEAAEDLAAKLARGTLDASADLDGVEVLGVVGEALSRGDALRIPVLREGLVGPGARADADLSHACQHTRRG